MIETDEQRLREAVEAEFGASFAMFSPGDRTLVLRALRDRLAGGQVQEQGLSLALRVYVGSVAAYVDALRRKGGGR